MTYLNCCQGGHCSAIQAGLATMCTAQNTVTISSCSALRDRSAVFILFCFFLSSSSEYLGKNTVTICTCCALRDRSAVLILFFFSFFFIGIPREEHSDDLHVLCSQTSKCCTLKKKNHFFFFFLFFLLYRDTSGRTQ